MGRTRDGEILVRKLHRGEEAIWRACTWRRRPRRRAGPPPAFTQDADFVAERYLLAVRGDRVVGRMEWVRHADEAALCDPIVAAGEDVAEVAGALVAEGLRRASRRSPRVVGIVDARLPYAEALAPVFGAIGLVPTKRRLLHARRGPPPREAAVAGVVLGPPRSLLDPVLVDVFTRCSGQPPDAVRAELRQSARARQTDWRRIVVAWEGGRALGLAVPAVIDAHRGLGTIDYVGVLPEARGRGLGRALTVRAIRSLAALGYPGMLDATDEGNDAMVSVLLGTGYRLRTVQQYFGP
jgi:GNAT superfamily N-acetyltransferase